MPEDIQATDNAPAKEVQTWEDKVRDTLHSLKGLFAILIGAIAFAFWLWFVLGDKDRRLFHNINWDSQEIVSDVSRSIIDHPADLDSLIVKKAKFDMDHRVITDTTSLATRISKYRNAYFKILYDLKDSSSSMSKAEWKNYYAASIVTVQSDSLDALRERSKCLPVKAVFKTSKIPGFSKDITRCVAIEKADYADDFMVRFPSFGLWALLIVLQLTMYPLIILWLFYKLFEAYINKKAIKETYRYHPAKWMIAVHLILCVAMCLVFYWFLLESDGNTTVKPQYFMFHVKDVLRLTNVLGYVNAGFCLAGMLLTYIVIRRIKARVKTGNEHEDAVKKEKEARFAEISENFKLYFAILAIILACGTLSTSALFTGLNSLPYVQELTRARGFSPFPNDFVLLYGLVHSAVLLACYILLKGQLQELRTSLNIPAEQGTATNTFFKRVVELLITGSPLLGPLLQSLAGYM